MSTNDYIEIAQKVFDIETKYLTIVRNSLNENFAKAAELILATQGKIIVCGIGKSGIIARKIATTFSSVGKAAIFLNAAEANHGDLGMVKTKDTMILLSNSGESIELVSVINYCKEYNIPIIAIVGQNKSTLYTAADIPIIIPSNCEVSHISMPTTSTTLMNVIGDALAATLVESNKITFDEYRRYHPGGNIGNSLAKAKELMRTGDNIPIVDPETQMSDALIIMTQKSLGCLVVVTEDREILGFITDGDLRRHLFDDLVNLKAKDIMSINPKVVSEEVFALEALEYMNKSAITSLIVAKNNKIVGIIHMHDCLRVGLKVSYD